MSKYIDMEVLADAKVDQIKQPILRVSGAGIVISPVMDGIANSGSTEVGLRYKNENGVQTWQYSNGAGYIDLSATGSVSVDGEVISFTTVNVDSNGKVTIQHNLGNKYPFGLDFTLMPKNIEFVDVNTLKLDYSDREDGAAVAGQVWFIGSKQSMLLTPNP